MQPIRTGVIGVGHIGRHHARICAELPQSELVGVFDADEQRCRQIAALYQTEPFFSLEELTARAQAVTIATPTGTHFPIARACLQSGCHVLVEKPIADQVEQARAMVLMAREKALLLQVGHVERFNPAFRAMEPLLRAPRFIEAHRLCPYPGRNTEIGVVFDLMIHDLDIVLHLVRAPVVSIDAVGVAVLSSTEDIANARIRFEGGAVANLTCSRISPEKMRKIRIFQDDAYLSLNYGEQCGEIYRKKDGRIERQPIPVEKDEPLKLQISSFLDCVRSHMAPVVDGGKAVAALDLAMQISDRIGAGMAAS
ncbi:scyllo-inositol 2-dehydrogenase (NAD(+)) [Methylacidimicrobium cyclopophantes]|uniref:Scyllo-inositol 2-dehydrogenase (NAD(+)) n=1 Tax=Methylacidimicrobium cyclopophantes TaxID=1041766 RepID=A0A5E6MDT5_9BACT|nr:Gfo/Idh/MocA family oxidoreductase [Methylacidimicrobium cyclopophantes]VVM07372.1 scyllo-inositol 2-dehydrogenase (NAD(+)) [Methylacidimicrobium cyclopophantes]